MGGIISSKKVEDLRLVLIGKASLNSIARQTHLSSSQLKTWLKEIRGKNSLKEIQAGFVIRKDRDGRYLWYNDHVLDLAPSGFQDLTGLSDFEIAPAKAEEYRAGDLEVMRTGKRKIFVDKVHFCRKGYYKAVAEIIPLHDELGKSAGILLFGSLDYRLAKQPYPSIVKLIRAQGAYALIRFNSYKLKDNRGFEIILSRREAEAFLYLLVGFSIKEIAESMKLEPSTVESYTESIKDKLGVQSKAALIDKLLDMDILDKI